MDARRLPVPIQDTRLGEHGTDLGGRGPFLEDARHVGTTHPRRDHRLRLELLEDCVGDPDHPRFAEILRGSEENQGARVGKLERIIDKNLSNKQEDAFE